MGRNSAKPIRVLGFSGLDKSVDFKTSALPGLAPRYYRMVQGLDAAAALIVGQEIVAAASQERFSRVKATGKFPFEAIQYCLLEGGMTCADVDAVAHAFLYEPVRHLYCGLSDYRRRQYEAVYSEEAQRRTIEEYFPATGLGSKLIGVPHHLAHAASAFYPSGLEQAAVLVSDGMGEAQSATAAIGGAGGIQIVSQIPASHSIGVLYGLFTHHLGFDIAMDEYKVMGLAPYGDPRHFYPALMDLVHLKPDGTYTIPIMSLDSTPEDQEVFRRTRMRMTELFGEARVPDAPITKEHKDLAAALQAVLQTTVMHQLKALKKLTALDTLCMAGGVALNCTLNGIIQRSRLFRKVFIQPAAGDDGAALGAALYVRYQAEDPTMPTAMGMPFWGPAYSQDEIREALRWADGCRITEFRSADTLVSVVSELLDKGKILGWFQGRMEFGPRALGNRSILADPRDPAMRDKVNQLVKKREEFRPFAPSVTAEAATRIFEVDEDDLANFAHMLVVAYVRKQFREKLPAVTHVDESARLQVVTQHSNGIFWKLLTAFGDRTGVPVLMNTSFNVRGQPIVCTPREAVRTMKDACLDGLVIGDVLVVPENKCE